MCAFIEVELRYKILIVVITELNNIILDHEFKFFYAGGYVASNGNIK